MISPIQVNHLKYTSAEQILTNELALKKDHATKHLHYVLVEISHVSP